MTFEDFNLNKSLLTALADLGLVTPTPIQAKVFNTIMAGKDVVGIAQTGTGKTFAYLLPILRMWRFTKQPNPQIVIVVPTRELVMQVVEEVQKLSKYLTLHVVGVYGGTNIRTQRAQLLPGVDIVVGTPGRLVDLLKDGSLKTKMINKLIIDEVDEMLTLGFRTQLTNIIDLLPPKRQNLMFSATMTEDVEAIIHLVSDYYDKIEAAPSGTPLENIDQYAYEIPNFFSKASLLETLLNDQEEIEKLLVFVRSRKMADALYKVMEPIFGDLAGVIHASKSQNFRFDAVEKFTIGDFRFLIATDLIARGIDVEGVTHIINFDLPETAEQYIHRIGRTGRAENKGVAISFIAEEELALKENIEELMSMTIPFKDLPEGVVISAELIPLEEDPVYEGVSHKLKIAAPTGEATHEKKAKNLKVNRKIRRAEAMKIKYKKPKTRGQKNKKSKK